METLVNANNFLGRDINKKIGQYNFEDNTYVFFIKQEKETDSRIMLNYEAF